MPKFEIFIPKSVALPLNLRLRLEADSWIEALQAGRSKLGESGEVSENVLVDIQADNTIHVTDAKTGRVFSIYEVGEEVQAQQPAEAITVPEPLPGPAKKAVEPPMAPPVVSQAPTEPPPPEAAPVVKAKPPKPSPAKPARKKAPLAQVVEENAPSARAPIGRINLSTSDEQLALLEDVFESTQGVHEQKDKQAALYFMLDLAMDKVRVESGSVFLADISSSDLSFSAIRGPKADELKQLKLTVPMGQGLVGFCAEEGVGFAVSDVSRDPRFCAKISEAIGYSTRSILCVPMQVEGRVFGVMELINHKGSDSFSEKDLNIASFIGSQLGKYLEGQA